AEIAQDADHLARGRLILLDIGHNEASIAVVVQSSKLLGDVAASLAIERAEQFDDDVLSTNEIVMSSGRILLIERLDSQTDEPDSALIEHHDQINRAGGLDFRRTILLIRIR